MMLAIWILESCQKQRRAFFFFARFFFSFFFFFLSDTPKYLLFVESRIRHGEEKKSDGDGKILLKDARGIFAASQMEDESVVSSVRYFGRICVFS
jgi:hypothetical protein